MSERDIELLNKYKLTEFTLSLLIDSNNRNYLKIVENLIRLGYLDKQGFLTDLGKEIVDAYTKVEFPYTEDDMLNLAKTIRDMYPAGIKPGSNKSWRGTEKEVIHKLYSVMKQHPDITKEEVVLAVNHYLNTGESSYRRTLPYFIEKFGESDMYDYIIAAREARKESINILLEGNDNDDDEKGRWLW